MKSTFAFVLNSPDLTAAQLQQMIPALDVYLQRDVAKEWGLAPPTVDTTVYASAADVPEGSTPIEITRTGDVMNALGYHVRGLAKEFTIGLSLQAICEVLGHELAETLVDPLCNAYDYCADGVLRAREVCDPTEGQWYEVLGWRVPNFILPAWSDPLAERGDRVDMMGLLPRPTARTAEGYIILIGPGGVPTTDPPMARERPAKIQQGARTARRMAAGAVSQ